MFYDFFLKFLKFSANIFICLISQVDIKRLQILILSESLKKNSKDGRYFRASRIIAWKYVSLYSNRCAISIFKWLEN
jgi:hypothetical protein